MKQLLIIRKIRCVCIAFVLLAIGIVFTSCSKEKHILLNNTWNLLWVETNANYSILEESIRHKPITFSIIEMVNTADQFVFKLSNTEIWGKVKIKNNKIDFYNIELLASDKSPFTQYFVKLLEEIDNYETEGFFLLFISKNEEKIKLVINY